MSQRIEIDPELPPVAFPRPLMSELYAHALETLPEECCGLVVGTRQEPFRGLFRCRNDVTALHRRDPQRYPRDGRAAFHMNELDYLEAARSAEVRGEQVTGVYHSHVNCGLYFSELDQAHAAHEGFPFPDAKHLVVSIVGRRVEGVGLFESLGAGGGFAGRRVVHAPR